VAGFNASLNETLDSEGDDEETEKPSVVFESFPWRRPKMIAARNAARRIAGPGVQRRERWRLLRLRMTCRIAAFG